MPTTVFSCFCDPGAPFLDIGDCIQIGGEGGGRKEKGIKISYGVPQFDQIRDYVY